MCSVRLRALPATAVLRVPSVFGCAAANNACSRGNQIYLPYYMYGGTLRVVQRRPCSVCSGCPPSEFVIIINNMIWYCCCCCTAVLRRLCEVYTYYGVHIYIYIWYGSIWSPGIHVFCSLLRANLNGPLRRGAKIRENLYSLINTKIETDLSRVN